MKRASRLLKIRWTSATISANRGTATGTPETVAVPVVRSTPAWSVQPSSRVRGDSHSDSG
ncbi:hypothetical protein [Microbacterium sp. NIBRBAC000506063]|uniref:hypothetical protein n=1 Tax=Microbacterium sp. NIBRBAC000506063 TaxID=2734618 RepID=UPI001BB5146D|nr:hypothetical protein [Microbacterium sp. NIBRBAC000506063]QTV80560.1 hypothetical protein KAE78_06815 [Microbacterium sp. NIBRBAC000506063]